MLKRVIFILSIVVGGGYLALHLVLGSQPVQSWIASEIRQRLIAVGYDLEISSVDFSLLVPKIYFSGVTLSSKPHAVLQIQQPVRIDKIRIGFEPIALLQKRVVISELVCFHPQIFLPHADRFYRAIETLVGGRKQFELGGGDYPITVKTVGVVDAKVDVRSSDPPFAVKTNAITAFVTNAGNHSQVLTLESGYLELVRQATLFKLSKVVLDIDRGKNSIRVNKAQITGDNLSVVARGTAPLPVRVHARSAGVNLSIEASVPLGLLAQIPELQLPAVNGQVDVKGNLLWEERAQRGSGVVRLDGVSVEGYEVGTGSFSYQLKNKELVLSGIRSVYGGGTVTGDSVRISLENSHAVSGELNVQGLQLSGLLRAIQTPDVPVDTVSHASLKIAGQLKPPFRIRAGLVGGFTEFTVNQASGEQKDEILRVPNGEIEGWLEFFSDRVDFNAKLKLLSGVCDSSGTIRFDHTAVIHADGKGLSLSELKHIAGLGFGGVAGVRAQIDVKGANVRVTGVFDTEGGSIAGLEIGSVKGKAQFQNALLSFEDLLLPSELEPVLGSGFVDFRPKATLYRFRVSARRVGTEQVFRVFERVGLPFESPLGGEISGKLSIDGGGDKKGLVLTSQGQARSFTWYGETWLSGGYSVTYTPQRIDLPKALLLKNSGALEVSGHFEQDKSLLVFKSHGLRAEELSTLGGAPFSGEIHGELNFTGNLKQPIGFGAIHIPNLSFRQKLLGEIDLQMKTQDSGLQVSLNGLDDKLRMSVTRVSSEQWKLQANVVDADIAPALGGLLKKDISSIDSITASGRVELAGDVWGWKKIEGTAGIDRLNANFRGSQMRLSAPVTVRFGKSGVVATDFELKGPDAELRGGFAYEDLGAVNARIDGNVDLQFIQPFIPFLDYGTGRVAAGLRMTGPSKAFTLLGNVVVDDATLRLRGITDELRSVKAQIGVTQESLSIERFDARIGGGSVSVGGDVQIGRFSMFRPKISIQASQVLMNFTDSLSSRFSGQFQLQGGAAPYMLSGRCFVHAARLSSLQPEKVEAKSGGVPAFRLEIDCTAPSGITVATDVFNSELKADLRLRGSSDKLGLLGTADVISGTLLFRETKFLVSNGTVKFESDRSILPRFNVQSRALVREASAFASQEYEILLHVLGVPSDYKIRLSSTPRLAEPEIISLLVLGVTNRSQEGNYADLGSAIAGQIPVPSKLQNELGVDIKLNTQTAKGGGSNTAEPTDVSVPSVRLEKSLTPKTKLSYSNTLMGSPTRELRIEQMLNDNLTANFSTTNRVGTATEQPLIQSYGVDIRYRFQFE